MNDNLAYKEELREELIDGKVVAMSPSPFWNHVSIAGNIYRIFANYLSPKRCVAIPDGFDLHLTEKDIFVPDMMVVCDRDKIKRNGVYGVPDLVVEVLSPRTAKNDKGYKKDTYETCGVPEYWIVDPAGKSIEIYLLTDGKYSLTNIYFFHTLDEIAEMANEEKEELTTEFSCDLYDDLVIRLEDVFGDLI